MSSLLRTRPVTTSAMLEIFDDEATIDYALAFEAAFARARASVGLITPELAEAIATACGDIDIAAAALADEVTRAGTLASPIVARVRAVLTGDAAREVHLGATDQDVADTVLMIQTVEATELLHSALVRIHAALARLAETYAATPALGPTRLPTSFGLRIAQWLAGVANAATRLATEASSCTVQLGGAAGTRAGLGTHGARIAAHMATALGLQPGVPWHSRRVGIAAIASALGILIGAIGTMATDLAGLARLGEVSDVRTDIAVAAASRAPGLVASILGGSPEGPVLTDLFLLAAGSAESMRVVAEGLEVNAAKVLANLVAANVGRELGEAVAIVGAILEHHRPASGGQR